MKNPYKTYKMKLTTLSPIFIGSGEELDKSQYIYDFNSQTVKIVDEKKFSKFLINKNLIDVYSNDLLSKNIRDLKHWLESRQLSLNLPIFSNTIRCKDLKKIQRNGKEKRVVSLKSLNKVMTCIKNSEGQAYIPGSSIKGAIRTAFCAYFVNKNKEKLKPEWARIKNAILHNDKELLAKIINNIESRLFKQIKYNDPEAEKGSVFSALFVGDSTGVNKNNTYITTRCDYAYQKETPTYMPTYLELIDKNVNIYFNLTINESITSYFTISKIISALKYYTQQQIELFEIFNKSNLYLPDELDEKLESNICLGGMNGYFNKNIIYSLAPTQEEATQTLRRYFANNFNSGQHLEYSNNIAPHTIKVVKYSDDGFLPIGWCNLSVEKEIDVSDITN